MNENLDVDFTQNAIESLKQSVLDLGAVINGLPAKMVQNVDFSQLKEVAMPGGQEKLDAAWEAYQQRKKGGCPNG